MDFKKKVLSIGTSVVMLASIFTSPVAAYALPDGVDTAIGIDTGRNCVYNGYKYDESEIAPGPHCYTTPDNSTVPKLAAVDESKTLEDLKIVENWSPLHPDHYLARGTFATRDITDAPRLENSAEIAEAVYRLPERYAGKAGFMWLKSATNVGDGIGAHDNIPIYTVDSSNPHQKFQKFDSTDRRVTTFSKLYEMTSGDIPLPEWGYTSGGPDNNKGGDRSFAIYDVATGIWRSYFHTVKNADGVWMYASAGYWYGDPNLNAAGDHNYWLGLIQGGSSVIGVSNELTQIGLEELKRAEINHAISVTFPNYESGASFPAKQSDGNLDEEILPKAGQMFTFPKDMDIDAYAAENGIDKYTASIMKAIQKHGGIIADRNTWSMAFNFEHPFGMGGTNKWKEDPEALTAIQSVGRNINKFPWQKTEWLSDNYAATLTNTVPTIEPVQIFGEKLVEVTPEVPTNVDADVDKIVIPEVEGVEYLINGEVVTAGDYMVPEGVETVNVSVQAVEGYVIADGVFEWEFNFTTPIIEPTPSPEPTVEPTEPVIPEPTEPVIPEPTEPIIPEPTEPVIPEPTEPVDPEPTVEPTVPAELVLELSETSVEVGSSVEFVASGFEAGEEVQFSVHSDPVMLPVVSADADGVAKTTWDVPDNFPAGEHTVKAVGTSGEVTQALNVVVPVVEPTPTPEPTVEPTEPTVEPTEPTVEPTEPTVEPTEPVSQEPTEPVEEPTEPELVEVVASEPVVDYDGRVISIPTVEGVEYSIDGTVVSGEYLVPEDVDNVVVSAVSLDGYVMDESPIQWSYNFVVTPVDPEPTDEPTELVDESVLLTAVAPTYNVDTMVIDLPEVEGGMYLVWTTRDNITFANSGEYIVPDGTLEIAVELAAADSGYSVDKTKPYAWLIDTTTGEIIPYDPVNDEILDPVTPVDPTDPVDDPTDSVTPVDPTDDPTVPVNDKGDASKDPVKVNDPVRVSGINDKLSEKTYSNGFKKNLDTVRENRKNSERLSDSGVSIAAFIMSLLAGGAGVTLVRGSRRKK